MQDHANPTDDEVAAALAAVHLLLAAGGAEPEVALSRSWRAAAIQEAQGLVSGRDPRHARWSAADRAIRAREWSNGITGL